MSFAADPRPFAPALAEPPYATAEVRNDATICRMAGRALKEI
jgi:hypothetical protein